MTITPTSTAIATSTFRTSTGAWRSTSTPTTMPGIPASVSSTAVRRRTSGRRISPRTSALTTGPSTASVATDVCGPYTAVRIGAPIMAKPVPVADCSSPPTRTAVSAQPIMESEDPIPAPKARREADGGRTIPSLGKEEVLQSDDGRLLQVPHLSDSEQYPGHERLTVDRVVPDRERLAEAAEEDLLVRDQPGQPDRVDRLGPVAPRPPGQPPGARGPAPPRPDPPPRVPVP